MDVGGADDGASDGCGPAARPRGARRARRKRGAADGVLASEAESRQFQPDYVDEDRCKGLASGGGWGREQCRFRPKTGGDVCGKCARYGCPHGRVRGPIPAGALDKFKEFALKANKPSKHWYARHAMWDVASKMKPELKSLCEVDEHKRFVLTNSEYEQCLKQVHDNLRIHKNYGRSGFVYEKGAGVRTLQDRCGEGTTRFGSERESYNGQQGGKVFMWYSRAVFNKYLGQLQASEMDCSEKDCVEALRLTSEEIRRYPMKQQYLKPYAGPQCYPHIDPRSKENRLHANEKMGHAPGEDPQGGGDGGARPEACGGADDGASHLFCMRNWAQCDRCHCWRLLLPACAARARG